jgi:hypothetical protein
MTRTGPIIRYNDRIYKPGSDAFEYFQETDDPQTMQIMTTLLDDAHELWQKALARCNARLYMERETLRKAQAATARVEKGEYNLDDIDEFYQEHGSGTHLLEYDFTPDTPDRVPYTTKSGQPGSYWCWTHKYTLVSVKRYASYSGKSVDSGRLSKYLASITERIHPLAFARARKILQLNESCREVDGGRVTAVALDRKALLKQQVSGLGCLTVRVLPFLPFLSNPHCYMIFSFSSG